MATYFITESYIKSNSTVNSNVDAGDLLPIIPLAEDMNIKNILGSALFNTLKTAYTAQTMTTDQRTLVAYIQPALLYRTYELALPFIHLKTKNKGVIKQSSEFGSQGELSDMKYLREQVKDFAEYYEQRLVDYLCNYGNLFSDYTSPDGKGILPDSKTPYDCDLYLPDPSYIKENRKYYGD